MTRSQITLTYYMHVQLPISAKSGGDLSRTLAYIIYAPMETLRWRHQPLALYVVSLPNQK